MGGIQRYNWLYGEIIRRRVLQSGLSLETWVGAKGQLLNGLNSLLKEELNLKLTILLSKNPAWPVKSRMRSVVVFRVPTKLGIDSESEVVLCITVP